MVTKSRKPPSDFCLALRTARTSSSGSRISPTCQLGAVSRNVRWRTSSAENSRHFFRPGTKHRALLRSPKLDQFISWSHVNQKSHTGVAFSFFGYFLMRAMASVVLAVKQPWSLRVLKTGRSEEHTSELQSHVNIVCRLLLEKKKYFNYANTKRSIATSPEATHYSSKPV